MEKEIKLSIICTIFLDVIVSIFFLSLMGFDDFIKCIQTLPVIVSVFMSNAFIGVCLLAFQE